MLRLHPGADGGIQFPKMEEMLMSWILWLFEVRCEGKILRVKSAVRTTSFSSKWTLFFAEVFQLRTHTSFPFYPKKFKAFKLFTSHRYLLASCGCGMTQWRDMFLILQALRLVSSTPHTLPNPSRILLSSPHQPTAIHIAIARSSICFIALM